MKKQTLKQKIDSIIKDITKQYFKKEYSEFTPIKLGLSQSDFTKISYITEKRQNELIKNNIVDSKQFTKEQRKKYFYHTSPAKLLKKFVDIDDEVQPYAEKLTQYIIEQQKIDLKVYEGSEIAQIYTMKNHRFGGKSCMQEKHKSYFEIYEHLPVKLYAIIENEELIARCLVWYKNKSNGEKQIYIDRIYTYGNDDTSIIIYKKIINEIAKIENVKGKLIHAYNCRNFKRSTNGIWSSSPPFDFVPIKDNILIDELNAVPYMDTFQYSCGSFLQVDLDSDTIFRLNCTGGTYEEIEQTFCDCCGTPMEEDEQFWCEDVQETRCVECARYSDVDDVYYAEENVTYISGNIESYVHNDDIQR